jgi:hypothetical protein
LRDKCIAGGSGTYTTTAPVGRDAVWMKQQGGSSFTSVIDDSNVR